MTEGRLEGGWGARYEELALSAQQLAVAGRLVEAEERLSEIPQPDRFSPWAFYRAVAVGAIAWKLIEAGAPSRAVPVLSRARRACEDMQDGAVWEAAYAFAWIGHLFARAGAHQEAVADWIRATDLAQAQQERAFTCVEVLEHVACDLAAAHHWRRLASPEGSCQAVHASPSPISHSPPDQRHPDRPTPTPG